ncbi:MAG: cobyrinate a,c-diamide synthase, partial [Victivallales bacterium]|nr:cobyrinate a,c-diamide synthase [Victivallales bacterium]
MMSANPYGFSACCLAAAGSGSGKTTVSLALMRALSRRGLTVQPFKCGPDYLDPGFHDRACHRSSRNLDSWMMGPAGVTASYAAAAAGADVAVIEGVMGLFDGVRPGDLSGSTAETARLTGAPVLLVVNARGMAGSMAALVGGFVAFRPEIRIAGVIADQVGSAHHAALLREALSAAALPPLLGYFPRRDEWRLPERHLGLVPYAETRCPETWFESLADAAEQYCDLNEILQRCRTPRPALPPGPVSPVAPERPCRLGVARDAALHFYYHDNLDLLARHGITPVFFSPLNDPTLPENLAGLYLGGGFPEIFAAQLADNKSMRQSIRDFAASGRPVYAECGGFMYLAETLTDAAGTSYPMCALVPGRAIMA